MNIFLWILAGVLALVGILVYRGSQKKRDSETEHELKTNEAPSGARHYVAGVMWGASGTIVAMLLAGIVGLLMVGVYALITISMRSRRKKRGGAVTGIAFVTGICLLLLLLGRLWFGVFPLEAWLSALNVALIGLVAAGILAARKSQNKSTPKWVRVLVATLVILLMAANVAYGLVHTKWAGDEAKHTVTEQVPEPDLEEAPICPAEYQIDDEVAENSPPEVKAASDPDELAKWLLEETGEEYSPAELTNGDCLSELGQELHRETAGW